MAKKADKALKSLKKDVAKLKKQNDRLASTLEKAREDQASDHMELRKLLEAHLTTHEVGPAESVAEDNSFDGEDGPEVTEAAERRARDLGVGLSGVEGTGSGGRILVKDVQAAAEANK